MDAAVPLCCNPGMADPSSPAAAGAAGPPTPAFSPLYQQIKSLLTQSLSRSEWKAGDALPSETELALRFKVSQGTVRKAIDELAADKLLVRRQGKGTFVATHAEAAGAVPLPAADARPGAAIGDATPLARLPAAARPGRRLRARWP